MEGEDGRLAAVRPLLAVAVWVRRGSYGVVTRTTTHPAGPLVTPVACPLAPVADAAAAVMVIPVMTTVSPRGWRGRLSPLR